jgi:hypothetical protein
VRDSKGIEARCNVIVRHDQQGQLVVCQSANESEGVVGLESMGNDEG